MTFPARFASPELRSLLHEKLDALLDECNLVMDNAKHGRAFRDLDDFFCTIGQDFLKEVYQETLQERTNNTDAVPETPQCPDCKKKRVTTKRNPKT
jgi:hypothetical protein